MNFVLLGSHIYERRRNRGLTQEQLAEKSQISASFMGHIERGSRKASLTTLVNIANALECGLDELLEGSLHCNILPMPSRLERIRHIVRELTLLIN